MGYERCETAESKGQFSVRGGIIDIYPSVSDTAFRIEFWDTEVDSIRTMDAYTQRSIDRVEEIEIYPVNEFFCDKDRLSKASRFDGKVI